MGRNSVTMDMNNPRWQSCLVNLPWSTKWQEDGRGTYGRCWRVAWIDECVPSLLVKEFQCNCHAGPLSTLGFMHELAWKLRVKDRLDPPSAWPIHTGPKCVHGELTHTFVTLHPDTLFVSHPVISHSQNILKICVRWAHWNILEAGDRGIFVVQRQWHKRGPSIGEGWRNVNKNLPLLLSLLINP